jgi:hypothetical protein
MYILDFNLETNELTFRTTFEPKHRQTEEITVKGDLVYTSLYHFPIGYIHKFIAENDIKLNKVKET